MSRRLISLAFLGLASIVSACGKSGDGGPCTTCPSPAIALGVSTNALTIAQGGNGSLVATITRSGGFTGAVTIVTEGAPAGVTATPSNVTTTGTVTTGTVTVDVAATVAPGTYNLVTRASGSGVTSVTQAVTLTVTAAPAVSLALSANAESIEQGAGATITATIARTNFTGTVNLSLEGAPTGVTALFVPSAVTGSTFSLTLVVGGAVPPALYNLTIRATGIGLTDVTTPLALTVAIPATFSLVASPVSIAQGSSGVSTITITRSNFTGPVTLTLEGAPAGVTGVFNPAPAPGGTSALTLSVDAAVPAAQYHLVVRGVSSGPDWLTTLELTVTPFVAVGTYTLTTTPAPNLLVGTSSGGVAFVVNINRAGGFTGPVTLTATGLLSSLSATITPSVVTGNSAVVSVVPDQSNQVSSAPATITGTTPGLTDRTVQLQISTAIPDLTFDYSACPANAPIWLAYQDGLSGPWIQLLPLGGKFKIKLLDPFRAGFAVVLAGFGNNHPSWVRLRSVAELKAITGIELCDQGNPGPKNVIVSTAHLGASESAQISMGGAVRNASSSLPTVTLMGVQNGVHDLVATNMFQGLNPFLPTARFILLRDLNVSDGQNIGTTLDFTNSLLAFSPITANITVQGLTVGDAINSVGTSYSVGASCTEAFLFGSTGGITTAFGIPGLKQRAGDVTGVSISTQNSTGSLSSRFVTEYFTGLLGDRAIALPSVPPVPAVTVQPGPGLRLRFAYSAPGDVSSKVFVNYAGQVSLDATSGWFGDPVDDVEFPDLSEAANFDVTWLPPSTATGVSWFFSLAGTPRTNSCAPGRVVGVTRNGSTP